MNNPALVSAGFRIRATAWLIDSLVAGFLFSLVMWLAAPDIASAAVYGFDSSASDIYADPGATTMVPWYWELVFVLALTGFGGLLGSVGTRAPAARLAGLRVVGPRSEAASRIRHLIRGAACSGIVIGASLWPSAVAAIASDVERLVPSIPAWLWVDLDLYLAVGSVGGLLLALGWPVRDSARRTLLDILTGTRVVVSR